jgi:hypothetical protein
VNRSRYKQSDGKENHINGLEEFWDTETKTDADIKVFLLQCDQGSVYPVQLWV